MAQENQGKPPSVDQGTTTSTPTTEGSSPRKKGRVAKTTTSDEKVSLTFSFSAGFAKRLRMAASGTSESTSEYVERHLGKQVRADLKKVMEGLLD